MEANLRSRLLTATVGIPLLFLVIGRGSTLVFSSLIFVLTVVALHEYFHMAFPNRARDQILGNGFGIVLSLPLLFDSSLWAEVGTGLLLLIYFSIYPFADGTLEEKLMRLSWILLGGFYLGYLLPHWAVLFRAPEGRAWVFFVLIVIMAGDSAAYFTGRAFGRKKLAPTLSPGKTVEGALGYFFGSAIAGLICGTYLFESARVLESVGLAVILALLGQLGDLFESWIKRVFAVKDSGHLLPGHGGLLDRLDSLIFPAVFTAAYLKVFHS